MKRYLKGSIITSLAFGFFLLSPVSSYAGNWQNDEVGWRYQNDDATYQIGNWFQDSGVWYHFDENGYMQTNWIQVDGKWYYLTENGAMLRNTTTPDGYQLDSTGAMIENSRNNAETGWHSDNNGWWYQLSTGGYVKEKWKTIDGKKYYFDESGYMVTGFYIIDGQYYYFDETGVLVKKNFILDDTRYFVDESGVIFDSQEIEFGDSYWWGGNTDNVDNTENNDSKQSWNGYEKENQADGYNDGYAQQVIDLVNMERTKAGKSELSVNNDLMEAAGIRAREIVDLMDHKRPDGSSWISVYEELNIDYHSAGENIAGGQSSPESVMKAWMDSAPHKKNILGNFEEIGVGCYVYNGRLYWVQLFLNS